MANTSRAACGLITGLLAVSITGIAATPSVVPQVAAPAQTESAVAGAYLFRTYCASCHGATAVGDGTLAAAMTRKPSDLTGLAKRNGGTYPEELAFRIIDGRKPVRGHGGADMPVWGDAFLKSVQGGDEAAVKVRIQSLVDYLATLQKR